MEEDKIWQYAKDLVLAPAGREARTEEVVRQFAWKGADVFVYADGRYVKGCHGDVMESALSDVGKRTVGGVEVRRDGEAYRVDLISFTKIEEETFGRRACFI